MSNLYSKGEKVQFIVDIAKKLQMFPSHGGGTINLYNDQYLFIDEFKKITNRWIHEEGSEFNGSIHFHEINKDFEYKFPSSKDKIPLFVLRN